MALNKTDKIIAFDYIVSATLTGNGMAQVTLTLAADSQFELHGFLANSSLDTATDFRPNNFSCQISDQSTGRQFANLRIPQVLLAGNANFALLERRPITFPALGTLLFDFLNLSGSSNTANIVLKGYKLLI